MILIVDIIKYGSDVRYIEKQVMLSLLLSPIWEIVYVIAMYHLIYDYSVIFFVLIIAVMLFYSIIYSVSQQKWLSKYSRIITRIEFKEAHLQINTQKILWKKAKTINIENTRIRFKKKIMFWWAKKGRDKTTYIFNIEGIEYYLIAEYFDEIDLIIEKLEAIPLQLIKE